MYRVHHRVFAAGVTLFAWVAACQGPRPDASIVARYDGGLVDRAEYQSWLAFKAVEDDAELRLSYAEKIALTEAYAAQALAAGLEDTPAVRIELEAIQRGVLTRALRRRVAAQVEVPPEEVERRLEAGRDRLVQPEKVRLRNIFKRAPQGAGEGERERLRAAMEEVRTRLLAGEDFAELAAAQSDSLSRHRGGRLGAIAPGQLRPEIEAAAFALEPGEVSPVIETAEGFTLLRCDGVVAARTIPDEEARERIRDFQHRRLAETAWRELREELLAGAEVTVELGRVRDPETAADAVVARIAGREVTRRELERQLRVRRAGPLERAGEEGLRRALEDFAFSELAARRARELGLADRPEVAARLAWMRSEALLTEEVRRRVEAEFVPPSEAELRAYYEAHRRSFERRPRYDLSVIRLAVDPASPRREVELAQELLAGIRSGQTSFAAAARRHSQHPSSASGGRLGWIDRRRVAALGPAVLRTVSSLEPAQRSEVVLQDRSLWILELHAVEPGGDPGFEAAKLAVERRLGTERGNELAAEIERRLIAALDVRLSDATADD